MNTKTFKPLHQVVHEENSELCSLAEKVQQNRQIDQLLLNYLDPLLLKHCQTGAYQNGCLTLVVDSAAWATHIRYLNPDLLAWLQQHPPCQGINTIVCKIQPRVIPSIAVTTPPRTPRYLSTKTANILVHTAEEIKHPKLRQALQRLAQLCK